MKFFFLIFSFNLLLLNFVEADALKKKLDKFKKETVTIHNDFIKNNNELKNIKIDIDRNSQKQIILNKRIKSGENVGRRLMFLLQEKIYLSPITKVINNLFFQSEDFVTKQIIREFFLKKVRLGINEYLLSFKTIAELNNELDDKLIIYKKKKDSLAEKLIILEKKIAQVAKLQKKVKVDVKLKVKEKRYKKKAKNLNELVQGVKRKKTIKKKANVSKVKFPVQGKIISNYGEGKDLRKSKNGLVFKVREESFVTSPITGMVVYANQFRSYGNLIIIENNDGYYCILSGMKKIIISSGIEVFMGEPIAKISADNNSQLYFELRLNGKIINPKSKVEIL
ncbi:MAG: peptidoglycan DD-metalloendopeptidase family protein [Pseudomonadota bacterium]|nr:peptidoglycan DD-metalloendopeptidase family protein [Pseudomonadota bacterium]